MSAILCVLVLTLQISRSWQTLPTCTEVLDHASCRLLPGLERCGRQALLPQARVMGGTAARLGEYPWVARLGYIRRDMYKSPVAYRCGGSVISDRYILTAAHCCYLDHKTQLVTVRLGELDTTKPVDCARGMCAPAQDYKVESFTVHEGFNVSTLHNDICLVRLKYPVEFNMYVSPICLPYSEEVLKANGATLTLEIAGWGKSYERPDGTYAKPEVLQKLRMPLVPLPTCQCMYHLMGINVTSNQLCAGGIPGEYVCGGDSGGPLMARYFVKQPPPHFFAVGVTSFTQIEPCAGKFPSVYVNVLKYIKWILDNMTP